MTEAMMGHLNELLRLAEARALTDVERAMLQEFLATEDGRLAAAGYQHLLANYEATGQDERWTQDELGMISAEIIRSFPRQHRQRRFNNGVRQAAFAGIAIVGLLVMLFMWSLLSQPAMQPATMITATPAPTQTPQPTPTPQPTVTLRAQYAYADLLNAPAAENNFVAADHYSQTVSALFEQWDAPVYLPQQMPIILSFIGALANEAEGTLEIAFKLDVPNNLVILSQRPVDGRSLTPPLPVAYQPLLRVDGTNVYEDQARSVGELSGYAYQYEQVYREGDGSKDTEWVVYNTMTWQQDDQLFTLTQIHDNLTSTRTLALIAERFLLTPLDGTE